MDKSLLKSISLTSNWLDTVSRKDIEFKQMALKMASEHSSDFDLKVREIDSDEFIGEHGIETEHVLLGIDIDIIA